mmetsp:Transcript_7331/g.17947  ORF Transcript_7331/g.17947 Transcript_7331/m.17947 type:complete len:165 (-) Transcript_7331:145-639(-)
MAPERDDGEFYLALSYIKAYRTQYEPDFVMISTSQVSTVGLGSQITFEGRPRPQSLPAGVVAFKAEAEKNLRNSGLSYCIIRPGELTDQPGGTRALVFEQDMQDDDISQGRISRADLADVCVKCLLDPRAVNVTFELTESTYAPTARTPTKEISPMLETLKPNT